MKQPFEAVIRILKTCKDGANDQILRYKYPLTCYLTDGKNQFIKSGMAEKSRLSVCCVSRFGFQPCPVCMGDPHDPLSLPCDHVYCLACIKQWLVPGQMYCPLCMQGIDDDFELKPSETIR